VGMMELLVLVLMTNRVKEEVIYVCLAEIVCIVKNNNEEIVDLKPLKGAFLVVCKFTSQYQALIPAQAGIS
ncbi:hypothetical protein CSB37_00005, partial [bacterium DOLZORAL124_38_8]